MAKEILFDAKAREKLKAGVGQAGQRRQSHPRTQGP